MITTYGHPSTVGTAALACVKHVEATPEMASAALQRLVLGTMDIAPVAQKRNCVEKKLGGNGEWGQNSSSKCNVRELYVAMHLCQSSTCARTPPSFVRVASNV